MTETFPSPYSPEDLAKIRKSREEAVNELMHDGASLEYGGDEGPVLRATDEQIARIKNEAPEEIKAREEGAIKQEKERTESFDRQYGDKVRIWEADVNDFLTHFSGKTEVSGDDINEILRLWWDLKDNIRGNLGQIAVQMNLPVKVTKEHFRSQSWNHYEMNETVKAGVSQAMERAAQKVGELMVATARKAAADFQENTYAKFIATYLNLPSGLSLDRYALIQSASSFVEMIKSRRYLKEGDEEMQWLSELYLLSMNINDAESARTFLDKLQHRMSVERDRSEKKNKDAAL